MLQAGVLKWERERIPEALGQVGGDGFRVGKRLEGSPIMEQGGPVRRFGGRAIPVGEVFRNQVVDGRSVREYSLLHLQTVERIELRVPLEDRGNDPFKLPLFTEGFPLPGGLADLAT